MALKNLKTDLKSLKYGQDRFNSRGKADSSGQPYITEDINEKDGLAMGGKDFLLRGGMNAPLDALKDGNRLTKYFTDLRSPSGFLFIAKQNLLSQVAVKTQTDLTPNEGVYTPLSTVIQASDGYSGTHVYKQGPNPFKGVKTYTDIVKGNGIIATSIVEVSNNRLVKFLNDKIDTKLIGNKLYSYSGGPGSSLGMGETNISLSDQRTGKNNDKLQTSGFFNLPLPPITPLTSVENNLNLDSLAFGDGDGFFSEMNDGISSGIKEGISSTSANLSPITPAYGFAVFRGKEIQLNSNKLVLTNDSTVSTMYKKVSSLFARKGLLENLLPTSGSSIISNTSVYPGYTKLTPNFRQARGIQGIGGIGTNRIFDQNTNVLTQDEIGAQKSPAQNQKKPGSFQQDFRTELGLTTGSFSNVTGLAPSYKPKNNQTLEGLTDSRVHLSSPGQEGNRINYSKGKILLDNVTSIVDKINFQPIYQSENVKDREDGFAVNDLVKFRIAALNSVDPSQKQYIHFRAFIDDFTDSYGATWTGQSYMGRGEQFYKYGGFSRDVSIGFTVVAQSKPELMAQYKKLNFLASNLAPTYSSKGYMGGPLVELTLGGWCYNLAGFIPSLSLGVPKESTWEIAINEEGEFDESVKEMPHMVNVTMKFTPIHSFRPEKQTNSYKGDKGVVSKYGKQQYIQLKSTKNNYKPKNFSDFNNIVTAKTED